jgi:hypothetical protein
MRTASLSPLSLTPQKAADFLGVGRTKLLALARAGKIKAKDIDGRYYFVTASLQKFLDCAPDALTKKRVARCACITSRRLKICRAFGRAGCCRTRKRAP